MQQDKAATKAFGILYRHASWSPVSGLPIQFPGKVPGKAMEYGWPKYVEPCHTQSGYQNGDLGSWLRLRSIQAVTCVWEVNHGKALCHTALKDKQTLSRKQSLGSSTIAQWLKSSMCRYPT